MEGAAAVTGLVAFSLHATRRLIEQIGQIQEAPKTIQNIDIELKTVVTTLELLKTSFKEENVQNLPASIRDFLTSSALVTALQSCGQSCDHFSIVLKSWTKHSKDINQIHRWDQLKVGLFGDIKIKAFTSQIGTCKTTLTLALTSMNFLLSISQMQPNDRERSARLQQQEESLRIEAANVAAQALDNETALGQVSQNPPARTTSSAIIEPLEASQQSLGSTEIDGLRTTLELRHDQQALINQVLATIQHERSITEYTLRTGNHVFDPSARVAVGLVGSAEEFQGTNNTIETGHIHAAANSKAFIGRGNFDLDAFFK